MRAAEVVGGTAGNPLISVITVGTVSASTAADVQHQEPFRKQPTCDN